MVRINQEWRSTFEDELEITRECSVATVVSGRSLDSHASLFLEYYDFIDRYPKMDMYDVWHGNDNRVKIRKTNCQVIDDGGRIIMTTYVPKTTFANAPAAGTKFGAVDSHHHSYILDRAKTINLRNAIQRFKDKADLGRYVYVKPGGAVGWMFTKKGHRGVNCADFVIKVLKEADITDIGYRLYDAPRRVAN